MSKKKEYTCGFKCCDCGKLVSMAAKRCKSCAVKECWKSDEYRLKKSGEKSPFWKGDDVGYAGIHGWVRRRRSTPICCSQCHRMSRLDLANISQEYRRDLNDWEWLCRRCHMTKDGRKERLNENSYMRGHPERMWKTKLSWTIVNDIRAKCKQGCSQATMARKYGVCKQNVSEIVRNNTWKKDE